MLKRLSFLFLFVVVVSANYRSYPRDDDEAVLRTLRNMESREESGDIDDRNRGPRVGGSDDFGRFSDNFDDGNRPTSYEGMNGLGDSVSPFSYGTGKPNLLELAESLNLTEFVKRAKESGLSKVINHEGFFTLFAPSNEAFYREKHYPNAASLSEKMMFHAAKGRVAIGRDVENETILKTLLGKRTIRLNSYRSGEVITANGRKISDSVRNVEARNGMIHVIDDVMSSVYEPRGTIVTEMVRNCPQHTIFLHLIKVTKLYHKLNDMNESHTLLAPTNRAFAKLNPDIIESLKKNMTLLKRVISTHILDGAYYSAGLIDGSEIVADSGVKVPVTMRGSLLKFGKARVSLSDYTAGNGVVHSLDDVLFDEHTFEESDSQGQSYKEGLYDGGYGGDRYAGNRYEGGRFFGGPFGEDRYGEDSSHEEEGCHDEEHYGGQHNGDHYMSEHDEGDYNGNRYGGQYEGKHHGGQYEGNYHGKEAYDEEHNGELYEGGQYGDEGYGNGYEGHYEGESYFGDEHHGGGSYGSEERSNEDSYDELIRLLRKTGHREFAEALKRNDFSIKFSDKKLVNGRFYTVFAPTDDGWKNAVETSDIDESLLLSSFIAPGIIRLEGEAVLRAESGRFIRIDQIKSISGREEFTANGVPVLRTQKMLKSGRVRLYSLTGGFSHVSPVADEYSVINRLLWDDKHSEFVKYITKFGLDVLLGPASTYTVLVPTNEAFKKVRNLMSDKEIASSLLAHHIIPGSYYTTRMINDGVVPTLGGRKMSVYRTSNGVRLNGDIDIIESDLTSSNGVIHEVDRIIVS